MSGALCICGKGSPDQMRVCDLSPSEDNPGRLLHVLMLNERKRGPSLLYLLDYGTLYP